MKQATGAAKVVVFDHNVRCAPMAQRGENGAHEPVKFAHNDYTIKSGPQRVRDLVPDAADRLLRQRFALINVWRPIRGPVEESPLAVCDAHSIAQRDFVPTDLKYRDRTGEVYSLAFNPNHRWFYFPQMQKNEACCSNVTIRWRTAGRGSARIQRLTTRRVHPTPHLAKVSKRVRWSSSHRSLKSA